ncbi:glycosyltransferase, partial [Myxococcota bacterium]|nr:glycosyltransferase [Myxococcota bacterium]
DRFDVLVHASAHESQGCALVEAALAALPIATTAVGVARELEARGVAIEVVDDARAEALADAVLRARRRGATSAARDAVLARWSVDAAARGFARVLEEAVSGDPG